MWSFFVTELVQRLSIDDDQRLWELAITTILSDTEYVCRAYQGKHRIYVEIGRCSHWMAPHNGGAWFQDVEKFAWPTGYGGKGFDILGLPEFDWSVMWEWNKHDAEWFRPELPVISRSRQHMLFRVTIPARTRRHVRAVVHTIWLPNSPSRPTRRVKELAEGYPFKKVDNNWSLAANWVGGGAVKL